MIELKNLFENLCDNIDEYILFGYVDLFEYDD
jgi:hypothetical protein